MIRYYVDEDLFLLEVSHSRINSDPSNDRNNPGSPGDPSDPGDPPATAGYDVTLIELPPSHLPHSPLTNSAHAHTHVHDNGNTWTRREQRELIFDSVTKTRVYELATVAKNARSGELSVTIITGWKRSLPRRVKDHSRATSAGNGLIRNVRRLEDDERRRANQLSALTKENEREREEKKNQEDTAGYRTSNVTISKIRRHEVTSTASTPFV